MDLSTVALGVYSATVDSNAITPFSLNLAADALPGGTKLAFRLTASYSYGGKSDLMTKDVEVNVLPVPSFAGIDVRMNE